MRWLECKRFVGHAHYISFQNQFFTVPIQLHTEMSSSLGTIFRKVFTLMQIYINITGHVARMEEGRSAFKMLTG